MIYPKAKRYNYKNFTSANFHAFCATFSRGRNGFAHECTLYYRDENNNQRHVEGLRKYINRTWERFNYESCLLDAIEDLPKELQELAKSELIEAHFKKVEEETSAFVNSFKTEYEKLPQSTKEVLKNTNLQSEEQAKATLQCMKMINFFKGL